MVDKLCVFAMLYICYGCWLSSYRLLAGTHNKRTQLTDYGLPTQPAIGIRCMNNMMERNKKHVVNIECLNIEC